MLLLIETSAGAKGEKKFALLHGFPPPQTSFETLRKREAWERKKRRFQECVSLSLFVSGRILMKFYDLLSVKSKFHIQQLNFMYNSFKPTLTQAMFVSVDPVTT